MIGYTLGRLRARLRRRHAVAARDALICAFFFFKRFFDVITTAHISTISIPRPESPYTVLGV